MYKFGKADIKLYELNNLTSSTYMSVILDESTVCSISILSYLQGQTLSHAADS